MWHNRSKKEFFLRIAISLFLLLCIVKRDSIASEAFDWKTAGHIAVQHGGRVKPLDTFARELVQQVYGESNYKGQSPVETYFHWMADGEAWSEIELFYIPKGPLRDALELPDNHDSRYKMSTLQQSMSLMKLARDAATADEAGEKLTFVQARGNELLNRMGTLSAAFTHEVPHFVPTNGGDPQSEWLAMPAVLRNFEDSSLVPENATVKDTLQAFAISFSGMYMSVRDERPDIFNTSVKVFLSTQEAVLEHQDYLRSNLKWETALNSVRPFHVSKWLLAGSLLSLIHI